MDQAHALFIFNDFWRLFSRLFLFVFVGFAKHSTLSSRIMICVSIGNVRKRGARSFTSPAFVRSLRLLLSARVSCRSGRRVMPQCLADRAGFRIQECVQRILDRLPDQSISMSVNLFFIDFDCSGGLCIFLRYIFLSVFLSLVRVRSL